MLGTDKDRSDQEHRPVVFFMVLGGRQRETITQTINLVEEVLGEKHKRCQESVEDWALSWFEGVTEWVSEA